MVCISQVPDRPKCASWPDSDVDPNLSKSPLPVGPTWLSGIRRPLTILSHQNRMRKEQTAGHLLDISDSIVMHG